MRWLIPAAVWLSSLWSSPALAQEWTSAKAPEIEARELPAVPAGWVTVPGIFLRVHGPEEQMDVMLRMARHGSTALPDLAEQLEVPIGTTVHVYVTESQEQFRQLQPGLPPTWADATAWPTLGAVFLRAPELRVGGDEPLEQVLEHELVHVLLGRAFAPNEPPSWLQEGVAQTLAEQVTPATAATLQRGAAFQGLIPLEALENGFPKDPRRAGLAYAEAADFVSWLVAKHGPETLPALIRRSAAGDSMSKAVYSATGSFLEELEQEWSSSYDEQKTLAFATFATQDALWMLGAFALVGAAVSRRRRFHKRLKEMEEEERLVDEWVEELYRRRSGLGAL